MNTLTAGVSFLDLTTGILCAFGVVSALRLRDRSGLGQRVDGSLLETALGLLNFQAEGFLLAGTVPKALGSAHPSLSPYRNFRCRDGQWVFIAGANDRLWRRLVGALGLADMADDPRFATNIERVKHRAELEQRVGDAIAAHDRDASSIPSSARFPSSACRCRSRRWTPVCGATRRCEASTPTRSSPRPVTAPRRSRIFARAGWSPRAASCAPRLPSSWFWRWRRHRERDCFAGRRPMA